MKEPLRYVITPLIPSSKPNFNSVFSFAWISYLTMAKNPVGMTVYPQPREKTWIKIFPKDISVKWKANSFIQNLNSDHHHSISYENNRYVILLSKEASTLLMTMQT